MTDTIESPLSRCAVIGDPVEHSKSPLIHSRFAQQTGINLEYDARRVEMSGAKDFVESFFKSGGTGLNVTVPLKETAFQLCRAASPRATIASAVNTLFLADGVLTGENTDGPGLIRDIQENKGFNLSGARTLVLGAGGAVRGILAAFVEIDIGEIVLANRTLERAQHLQKDLANQLSITVSSFEETGTEAFDLIINGTSASLGGELPPVNSDLVTPQSCCYDLMYADADTAFVTWAKQAGAGLALDGIGMLVEQAADSFEIWHGVRPETAGVIEELRSN